MCSDENVATFSDSKRYKFDLSQIESVDQMLQGAKMAAQGYLSPVAEENLDGTGREATQLEKDEKMYERYGGFVVQLGWCFLPNLLWTVAVDFYL